MQTILPVDIRYLKFARFAAYLAERLVKHSIAARHSSLPLD
jgi:hypothetical protein